MVDSYTVSNYLKHAARTGLNIVSAAADPLFRPVPSPRFLIYHQVGTSLGREMEVSIATFREQLALLREFGEVSDIDRAIESHGESDASGLFVVTFDDGFEDVYHHAFPLLEEMRVPFTLYITTRPIETGQPIDPRYPDAKPLSWDQVNEMKASGLATIGAHTHTHVDLRDVSTDRIVEELEISNELIRRRTDTDPRHFTYPWGWWSDRADAVVRDLYESATLGGPAPLRASSALHALERLPIKKTDSMGVFMRKLRGGHRLEAYVRRYVHRVP